MILFQKKIKSEKAVKIIKKFFKKSVRIEGEVTVSKKGKFGVKISDIVMTNPASGLYNKNLCCYYVTFLNEENTILYISIFFESANTLTQSQKLAIVNKCNEESLYWRVVLEDDGDINLLHEVSCVTKSTLKSNLQKSYAHIMYLFDNIQAFKNLASILK